MGFPKGFNPWQYRKKKEEEKEPEPVEVIVEEPEIIQEKVEIPYKVEPKHKTMLAQIQELRRSVNRHAIGLEKALQDYQDAVAKPKCIVCYVNKGYLVQCVCHTAQKEVKINEGKETDAQDASEREG